MSTTVTVTDDAQNVTVIEGSSEETITISDNSQTVTVVEGASGAGDAHFEQSFAATSSVTVTHDLGKKPAVTITDTAGDEVFGDIQHITDNQFIVTFSANTTGDIFCN